MLRIMVVDGEYSWNTNHDVLENAGFIFVGNL